MIIKSVIIIPPGVIIYAPVIIYARRAYTGRTVRPGSVYL